MNAASPALLHPTSSSHPMTHSTPSAGCPIMVRWPVKGKSGCAAQASLVQTWLSAAPALQSSRCAADTSNTLQVWLPIQVPAGVAAGLEACCWCPQHCKLEKLLDVLQGVPLTWQRQWSEVEHWTMTCCLQVQEVDCWLVGCSWNLAALSCKAECGIIVFNYY